jgi:hypothetical protein
MVFREPQVFKVLLDQLEVHKELLVHREQLDQQDQQEAHRGQQEFKELLDQQELTVFRDPQV